MSIDNKTTIIRNYQANGKRAVDSTRAVLAGCKIDDVAFQLYDTMGRIIQYQKANYSWYRSYDSSGVVNYETIITPTDTIRNTFEHQKQGDQLKWTTKIKDGTQHSITRYKKRKTTTTYLNENRVEVVKYNSEKKTVSHTIKERDLDGNKYFFTVKNTYNSQGELVKSVSTQNGKQTGIVETFYENGREVKEIRRIPELNTIITTFYRFE